MRNTTLIVLLLLVLNTPFTKLHAQTPITSCNTQFTDSENFSNYLNNANDEWLICPDEPAHYLTLTFTQVDIEAANNIGRDSTGCHDILYIYDGLDSSAPMLGSFCGEASGTGKNAFVDGHTLNIGDTFRPKNEDGCFYIRFESDLSKSLSGWVADVTCCTPSLNNGLTDGIDKPTPKNNGNTFNLVIDNSCTRFGDLGMFTEFEPSGESCYTKGLSLENQAFYAFTSNATGGFVEFEIDSLDSVGVMEMVVFGPVTEDSSGNYVGGYINDCVSGQDPWSLFFNAGPNQLYILGVATEIAGNTNVQALPSSVGLNFVLPVTLVTYDIATRGRNVELSWTTSQETNNDKYEIYRSYDGISFEIVGERDGQKNTRTNNSYSFLDDPKTSGDVYYYVKQIDLDGRYSDFSILKAKIDEIKTEFYSYPNPSIGGNFSLKISSDILASEAQVMVYDQMGKQVVDQSLNESTSFDFPNLTSGIYTIKIITGSTLLTQQHMIY